MRTVFIQRIPETIELFMYVIFETFFLQLLFTIIRHITTLSRFFLSFQIIRIFRDFSVDSHISILRQEREKTILPLILGYFFEQFFDF